jgi:hypothetical protein
MMRRECQESDICVIVHIRTDQTHLDPGLGKVDKDTTQAFNPCAELRV